MLNQFTKTALQLRPGETQSLVLKQAQEIKVKQGRVWITISGVSDDYWLNPGDIMLLPAHMQVVIQADHQPAELCWQALRLVSTSEDAVSDGNWFKQLLARWHFA